VTRNDAEKIITKHLTGKRLKHSRSTAKLATYMGKVLGVDEKKLYIAGLLHDIAKPLSLEELLKYKKKYKVPVDQIMLFNKSLLHAPIGAAILQNKYNLKDQEILKATISHTSGKPGIGLFEKIIFAADFLDPFRAFPIQKTAWKYMHKDFNRALLFMLEYSINHVMQKKKAIHPDSIKFYNELLTLISDKHYTLMPVSEPRI